MVKHSINLDHLNAQELNQLIEEAKAKLAEKSKAARAALIEEMTEKAAQLGLSLDALIGSQAKPQTNVRRVRRDAGAQVAPKYRSPEGETWSGRGRMPRWLGEAVSKGKTKDEFAI
ncbi:MAG TPA: H-NS histone family protein [Roseomonas sp.]|jgi:DNA-binding protein H-NS